ncbi:prephenate dehydrogenase [Erwinia sp. OLTSP20]|uniref:primosomal replication protein PriC n=1 Tax=unclassified Erwinia TaxID=2622719 RepID=UPI000C19245D|nr:MULTISPECIES: primosomal replication protein [unclassified Erwinia]PIJ50615.1 prephenate dehydrogenase [Erwinia sp. OAMSP11]PIJ72661.1 prephenate dehydrogenase [Erwinia sp. OLSSP12]PIJ83256.1 prephenate dehydrogenase [Erwinia sp. OLCASP19]PIJ85242.1 prephenate dehydrogenase [Erwinia sp. OLMTSP26]PIJ87245.1 prephenate dehydrogenase [Erwinia sp. OLMDSP33]
MKSARLLTQLQARLTELAERLTPVAQQRSARARFDNQLFHSQSVRLADCLQEADRNMAQLRQAVTHQRSEQVAWYAERLVLQITALERELATQTLRKTEPAQADTGKTLYEKLAEHQEYERRLQSMIADRERQLESGVQPNAPLVQREIAALEGRLQRCRQALKNIERRIESRESHD